MTEPTRGRVDVESVALGMECEGLPHTAEQIRTLGAERDEAEALLLEARAELRWISVDHYRVRLETFDVIDKLSAHLRRAGLLPEEPSCG